MQRGSSQGDEGWFAISGLDRKGVLFAWHSVVPRMRFQLRDRRCLFSSDIVGGTRPTAESEARSWRGSGWLPFWDSMHDSINATRKHVLTSNIPASPSLPAPYSGDDLIGPRGLFRLPSCPSRITCRHKLLLSGSTLYIQAHLSCGPWWVA